MPVKSLVSIEGYFYAIFAAKTCPKPQSTSITLKPAEIYGDIPIVGKQNCKGLGIIDGVIIPHMNQKSDEYDTWLKTWNGKSYILYDGDGIVIE